MTSDIKQLFNEIKEKLNDIAGMVKLEDSSAKGSKIRSCFQLLSLEAKKFSSERLEVIQSRPELQLLHELIDVTINKHFLEMDTHYLQYWNEFTNEYINTIAPKIPESFKQFYLKFVENPERLAKYIFDIKAHVNQLEEQKQKLNNAIQELDLEVILKEAGQENRLAGSLSKWDILTPMKQASQMITQNLQ